MQNLALFGTGSRLRSAEDAGAQGHQFDLLLKPVPPTELLFELGKMINGTAAIQAVLPERAKAKEDPSR
jgi:hypothetical protein